MKVGRNFLIYLSSSMLSGILPVLLLPILTRELEPEEFGVLITLTTLVAVTTPVINFGVIPYLGVQYFRSERTRFGQLFSTLLVVPVTTTVLLVAVYALAGGWIATQLDIPRDWVVVVPLIAAAAFIPMATLNLLRMRDQPFSYAATELSNTAINFALTLALVLAMSMAWQGRLLAVWVANILISVAAFAWLLRVNILRFTFEPRVLQSALHFGLGVVPHDLANQAMRLADRLLVALLVGQTALGGYGVATQIASVMLVILGALNRAWTPFVFSSLTEDTDAARVKLVRRSYLVQLSLLALFIAFTLATPVAFDLLVDRRYHEAQPAVFWLTLGYLFNGIYLTVVDRIFFQKKTHHLAAITVLNAICSVGLATLLAQTLGVNGIPIAFAISSGVVMLAVFVLTQRLSPLPWLRALKQ